MDRIAEIREQDRLRELRHMIGISATRLVMPLFLIFWLADVIYVPELKWHFLFVRLLIVPYAVLVILLEKKIKSVEAAQYLCLFLISFPSILITYISVNAGGVASIYYAGLNLVAFGAICFFPWSGKLVYAAVPAIYAPLLLSFLFVPSTSNELKMFAINSFFIVGTIAISLVIRLTLNKLKDQEIQSRVDLENEIASREKVIAKKTSEGIALSRLSTQFSPQVVEAIRSGRINLGSGIKRSSICVIYVDIVNFSEKVNRLDHARVAKVIEMFTDVTTRVFLKYDLTIDKYIGDCGLAFANEPVKYTDYVERTVLAGLEIRALIKSRQEEYDEMWDGPFEIRTGIDVGYAGVGFYGSEKGFRSYTAVGRVMNLANRLCSAAKPNQILVSNDLSKMLSDKGFKLKFVDKMAFKGFAGDILKVFELEDSPALQIDSGEIEECPNCKIVLHLDNDAQGMFVFKCRNCGYVQKDIHRVKVGAAKKTA